jgi:hypothetical protein
MDCNNPGIDDIVDDPEKSIVACDIEPPVKDSST